MRDAARRVRRVVQIRVSRRLVLARLGIVPYAVASEMQRALAEQRRHDAIDDTVLFLEHPHTYTFGRRSAREHLLWDAAELSRKNIAVFEADRGGDITYHGPGQLVGYPIFQRSTARPEVVLYLRDLERTLLACTRQFGIAAELKPRYSGVWVKDKKICALGVKVDAYGVTSHGFALNVDTDLSYFGGIVPCGIRDMGVTSIVEQLGRPVEMRDVMTVVADALCKTFGYSEWIEAPADGIYQIADTSCLPVSAGNSFV